MDKGVQYSIRGATREDMASLLPLVLEEGWNDSLEYLEGCFNHYPSGHFTAVDTQGQMIAHCGANPCDAENGYVTNYVTKKSHRGLGIGRQVYEKALQSLNDRNIVLNANIALLEMYKKLGFPISSFKIHGYRIPMKSVNLTQDKSAASLIPSVPIADIDIEMLFEYDKKINPTQRFEDIRHCLRISRFGLAVMKDGKVIGWGAVTKRDLAYSLFPIYADSSVVARALVYSLLKQVPEDGNIEVGFPTVNTEAQNIFEDLNITSGTKNFMMRMYSKHDVALPLQNVFSVMNYHTVLI